MNLATHSLIRLTVSIPILTTLVLVVIFQAIEVRSATAGNDGKKIFNARCSICHGADGSGNTPSGKKLKASDLRTAEVQKQSDDQLIDTVVNGIGKMPGFEKKLSPDQVQQVLAYIRELGQNN